MRYVVERIPKTLDCAVVDTDCFVVVQVFSFVATDAEGPRVKANREAARLNRLVAEGRVS